MRTKMWVGGLTGRRGGLLGNGDPQIDSVAAQSSASIGRVSIVGVPGRSSVWSSAPSRCASLALVADESNPSMSAIPRRQVPPARPR